MKINLKKIETPLLKRNIHDNIKVILIGNLNEENLNGENKNKVKIYYS